MRKSTSAVGLVAPAVVVFASATILVAYWDSWPGLIGFFGLLPAVFTLDDAVRERSSSEKRGVFVVVYEWLTGLATGLGTLALLGFFAILGLVFVAGGAAMVVSEGEWDGLLGVGLGLFVLGLVAAAVRGD